MQHRDVKDAVMGLSIFTDQPAAVDADDDRQLHAGHIVIDLIVSALQERRIDRDERALAACRQSGRKGHGVFLGDAAVKEALRKTRGQTHPASRRPSSPV